jgi:hypothetical protein
MVDPVGGLVGCVTLFGIGVHGFFSRAWPIIIDVSNVLWALILGFYFALRLKWGVAA